MCAQLLIACVSPSPRHDTAQLYSIQFRCVSITTEFFIVPPLRGRRRYIMAATVASYRSLFFSPLVSSKLTRLHVRTLRLNPGGATDKSEVLPRIGRLDLIPICEQGQITEEVFCYGSNQGFQRHI